MEDILQAFNIVLGEDFVAEMLSRLVLIGCIFGGLIVLVIAILIWKAVACAKIKKAILALSEFPDNAHADGFLAAVGHISGFGRWLAKLGGTFSGLSKTDCRVIFNSTVLLSGKMTAEKKNGVRSCLLHLGCTGLTDASITE